MGPVEALTIFIAKYQNYFWNVCINAIIAISVRNMDANTTGKFEQ